MPIFRGTKNIRVFLTLAVLGSLISLTYILYKTVYDDEYHNNERIQMYQNKLFKSGTKTILLWTPFFSSKTWYLPEGDTWDESFFEQINCPATNCVITTESSYLPSIDQFDAVLFHGAESFTKPPIRNPHQFYVFSILESPAYTSTDLSDAENFFNLTMTYRLNSDINWAYGHFRDIETGGIVSPTKVPNWRKPSDHIEDNDLRNQIQNKTKMGAWFVSHCNPISKRDKLVESLQQYIEIDVYGKCGPFKCPTHSPICDKLLDNDYKFYFSFENSLCKDYVTEKFFNALKRQLVPVVFGGADYNRFAPPHSYIDANQFRTSKDLADYLLYLDTNWDEYIKYFWWRKYYTMSSRSHFCDLCSRLNDPNESEKTQVYRSIFDWWFGYSCDLKAKINF